MIQVHFQQYLIWKNPFPAQGLEPTNFLLKSSCQGTTFLTEICKFPINPLVPIGSPHTKTDTVANGILYIK